MRRWFCEKLLETGTDNIGEAMGYHDKNFGESEFIITETHTEYDKRKAEKLGAVNTLHAYAKGYVTGVSDRDRASADRLQDGLRNIASNNPAVKNLPFGEVELLIQDLLARHYPEG